MTIRKKNPAVVAYNARRCHVCKCKNPMFGFGHPLTIKEIWACTEHYVEVGKALEPRRVA